MSEFDHVEAMRARSGSVEIHDPLVDLFYTLLRDHVHMGDLEKLVQSVLDNAGETKLYTNGWLARYAQDIVARRERAREGR